MEGLEERIGSRAGTREPMEEDSQGPRREQDQSQIGGPGEASGGNDGDDDAAAATIAAVAAAAAASHRAQEHLEPQPEDEERLRDEAADRALHIARSALQQGREPAAQGEEGDAALQDGQEDVTQDGQDEDGAAAYDEQTEHAAQQAVADAAAAAVQQVHHHHQQQQQQNQQRQQQSQQHQQQRGRQSANAGQRGQARASNKSRRSDSPSGSGNLSAAKRRKINTCLQCKARKVKCDKVKPLCGPCKKHGIVSGCNWALEGDANGWTSADFVNAAAVATGGAANGGQSGPSTSGGAGGSGWPSILANQFATSAAHAAAAAAQQTLGTAEGEGGAAGNATSAAVAASQALAERIARLEAQLTQSKDENSEAGQQHGHFAGFPAQGDASGGHQYPNSAAAAASHLESLLADRGATDASTSATQQLAAAWSSQFANASESERGMAADALAMIAQHQPQSLRGSNGGAGGNVLTSLRCPLNGRTAVDAAREAMQLLPSDDNVHYLLFNVLDGLYTAGTSFAVSQRLLASLWARIQQQRDGDDLASVDLAGLALVFHLLAFATDITHPGEIAGRGIAEKEEAVPGLVDMWLTTGEALLLAADYMGTPNLCCVMALTVARQIYANQGRVVQSGSMLALAIRMAQSLGLDRLQSAHDDEAVWLKGNHEVRFTRFGSTALAPSRSEVLGLGDPMGRDFSYHTGLTDPSHLMRETARKVWYHLVVQDWMTFSREFRYQIPPGQWDTALPVALDESDLAEVVETPIVEQALKDKKKQTDLTDASSIGIQYEVARLCAEFGSQSTWGSPRQGMSYDTVLNLDSQLQDILKELPIPLRLDGESEHSDAVREHEQGRPYLPALRFHILTHIHHCLLLLHRSFLIRGHSNKRFKKSVRSAVDAARMVIFIRQSLAHRGEAVERFWALKHHVFNAALVLCARLLRLCSGFEHGDEEEGEPARLREEISVALTMLEDDRATRTNTFPVTEGDIFARGRRMVTKLLEVADTGGDVIPSKREQRVNPQSFEEEEAYVNGGGSDTGRGLAVQGGNDASADDPVAAADASGTLNTSSSSDMDLALARLVEEVRSTEDKMTSGKDAEEIWKNVEAFARPGFV